MELLDASYTLAAVDTPWYRVCSLAAINAVLATEVPRPSPAVVLAATLDLLVASPRYRLPPHATPPDLGPPTPDRDTPSPDLAAPPMVPLTGLGSTYRGLRRRG